MEFSEYDCERPEEKKNLEGIVSNIQMRGIEDTFVGLLAKIKIREIFGINMYAYDLIYRVISFSK